MIPREDMVRVAAVRAARWAWEHGHQAMVQGLDEAAWLELTWAVVDEYGRLSQIEWLVHTIRLPKDWPIPTDAVPILERIDREGARVELSPAEMETLKRVAALTPPF